MIQIKNLTKTYSDGTKALKDINLSLPTGMVGLLGPNGAGKSSLMRTIVGLQSADQGQVLMQGHNLEPIDVLQNPQSIRQTLGYMPQYFGVYPNMSCSALLKHMAVLKGLSKTEQQQQIPKLLTLTNLQGVANKSVSNFSGGMKQRFGIAQALLGDPKVVIMDEPTAGLDPEERERLHDMLISISSDRLILLSTHIVEDVENLCHHSALLFDGEIKASDSVSQLVATMQDKIWTSKHASTGLLLNKSFKFGQSVYRIYSETKPNEDAVAVPATLQDFYFYTRAKAGETC